MEHIKETIVVEGKDDESAVKKAVVCDVIITHGFGISASTWLRIEKAAESVGIIVLTDPDFAGEKIRDRIANRVKNCKHAFISKSDAMMGDDIGVENASPEVIIDALSKVKTIRPFSTPVFTKNDLVRDGLSGGTSASEIRAVVGKELGIGYCNAKQFLNRLNHYGVTKEEYNRVMDAYLRRKHDR